MRAASIAIMLALLAGPVVAEPFEDGLSAHDRQDYVTAMRIWRLLADKGDARAQSILGIMYAKGQGVPKDDGLAVLWYRLAAEQGNAAAQYNLGVMYVSGRGVPKDDSQATKCYRLAAEQGNAAAQYNLGVM